MGEVFKVEMDVKRARILAHQAVDRFWKNGHCSRGAMYAWMRRVMKLTPDKAHIKQMNMQQCMKLIELAEEMGPGTEFWARWYRKGKTRKGGQTRRQR